MLWMYATSVSFAVGVWKNESVPPTGWEASSAGWLGSSEEELRVAQIGLGIWSECLPGGVLACPAGRSLRNRSRIHWRGNTNNPAVSETKLKGEGELGSGLSAPKTEDEYGKAAFMSSHKVTKN